VAVIAVVLVWGSVAALAAFDVGTKLTASDAAAGDIFGVAVAVSGDTAVIGASNDDDRRGSAYVFVRSGGVWSEEAKLMASDAAPDDDFGFAVAVSGDTAVIGARQEDPGGINNQGSAYVFTRSNGVWSEEAKLTASDPGPTGAFFGWSVALSNETAVIGAITDRLYTGPNWGAAYVFTRANGVWSEEAKLIASDSGHVDFNFGYSVGVSGDTAVIGSWNEAAYVFTRSHGVWSEETKLIASDAAPFDDFGESVAVSGDTVVVGARSDDDNANQSGSAYVFTRSNGTWSEETKLTASDAAAREVFGWSVAASADTVVIGAPWSDEGSGSAYVFEPKRDVEIDIKPGSRTNPITLESKGVIPVAVLGSANFDVALVDVAALAFGPNAAPPAHEGHLEDVNGDRYLDLVAHYPTQETGILEGDTQACLKGDTTGGIRFHGCDSVRITPPR
jgi:hypothetical protein